MHNFLENFVEEDTVEAWDIVKSQMPWNFARSHDAALFDLKLEAVELIDAEKVSDLSINAANRTLWYESHIDPIFSVGQEDFYPYVIDSKSIGLVDHVPDSINDVYLADKPWPGVGFESSISFLAVSCIRCQLISLDGDTEADFDPYDFEDWVEEDCPACHGEGEWVYDPIR